jgi:hypothetical protein
VSQGTRVRRRWPLLRSRAGVFDPGEQLAMVDALGTIAQRAAHVGLDGGQKGRGSWHVPGDENSPGLGVRAAPRGRVSSGRLRY